jgi:hypothetical protein
MTNQNSPTPRIPAEFRDAAAEAQAAEGARRRAFREQVDRDLRCQEAVWAFRHATNDLWIAPPDVARSFLAPAHATLLQAVQALADVGRLAAWADTDHERTYDGFRVRNHREMSRASYDWAKEMFDRASKGELPEDLLVETWDEEPLRDALRWLSIFVEELSGEGAMWHSKTKEPPTLPPIRPRSDRDPPGEQWMPASEAVKLAEKAGLKINLSTLVRFGEDWGVKMRPKTLPGNHRREVEYNSLVLYLARPAAGSRATGGDDVEPWEGQFDEEIAKAHRAKQSSRSPD